MRRRGAGVTGVMVKRDGYSLDDRYAAESGDVLMTGTQALVRLVLQQRRLDARRGIRSAAFVSGYQGSPLGGVDREMGRASSFLDHQHIVFKAGLNEELAATAVAGTQLIGEVGGRRYDGVTGFWFGKNPGLDRAADAIRHANVSGTSPLGGAVAWIGDDPSSKSSTIPSSSEPMCRSLLMPLLAPGSVSEVITFGLHAVALSRYSGLWTGLKIVADIADATAVIDTGELTALDPPLPRRTGHKPQVLLPPMNLDAEFDLMASRLALAQEYAELAQLNAVLNEPDQTRLAILAAGMSHQAVLTALSELGIDEAGLGRLGIRLVRIGMPWPLDPTRLREFSRGAERVLVVEDKLPFVEDLLKQALYGQTDAPEIVGKTDAAGRRHLPLRGSITADDVSTVLLQLLPHELLPDTAQIRLARRHDSERVPRQLPLLPARTPAFCSGCPHSTSTRTDADQLVGVGIGCHIMVALEDGDHRGKLVGMPQMGGEGAQWLGISPFTDDQHFVQNLGDGTFYHSGSLAVRAAVAAQENITYRLLFNDAVAMTGGQRPEGQMDLPALTRWLALEGVRRIIVTTAHPKAWRRVRLDPIAEVRPREQLQDSLHDLAEIPGVTVLLHIDRCATEERRLRKRGMSQAPAERIWINERVCEGCGDCGEKSTCLSVQPVPTAFGRKTQIHQSSCNQDFTCLAGDCPSFLEVLPGTPIRKETTQPPIRLPEPTQATSGPTRIRMVGIGGTGVVTVSQILQAAAMIGGRYAAGLEQIGLAQKGGPVVSDLVFADDPVVGQLRATEASVDVLLAFDALGAGTPANARVLKRGRTVAVIDTAISPTAEMVRTTSIDVPEFGAARDLIDAATDAARNVRVDAQSLSEALFGDHMPANMILVGAAFQAGLLPLSAEAIEAAIRLNGAVVDKNLAAFRWGRAVVACPEVVEHLLRPPAEPAPPVSPEHTSKLRAAGLHDAEMLRFVGELVRYQNAAYADEFIAEVTEVERRAREVFGPDGAEVTATFAAALFKLKAYKDEYEVARLHLDAAEIARRQYRFGTDARVRFLLHPPFLRALGLKKKLRCGPWILPLFSVLYWMRRVRGSWLDPFGRTAIRQLERALPAEHTRIVWQALEVAERSQRAAVLEIAALPDLIRGYEEVKTRSVERFRDASSAMLSALTSPEVRVPVR